MGSSLYSRNMNIFYISLVIVGVTAQQNGDQMPPTPSGLCLDPRMMSAVCTINTEIGMKMEQAHFNCAAASQVQERKKKKNKGKGKGKERDVKLIWTLLMSFLLMFGRRRPVFSKR